jgi:hypothetical protein
MRAFRFVVSSLAAGRGLGTTKLARGRARPGGGQDVDQFLEALEWLLPAGAYRLDDAHHRASLPSRPAIDTHDVVFLAHGALAFFDA